MYVSTGRRMCMFQMHHTDADERLFERNAVVKVRESDLFDRVVLAVADVPENRCLERWAEAWGVEILYGAERDVARRLLDCARAYRCDTLARALVWWFFLDLDLVEGALRRLETSGADYVRLPRDCDIRFGADVFTTGFLEKALHALADDGLRQRFQMNPWGYAEAFPEAFRIETEERVPVYDRGAFHDLRTEMSQLWPERWDGAATPLFPYRLASSLLPEGGRALDVACGLGAGTALLAERGAATGVDSSAEAIEACRARWGDRVEFRCADAMELDLAEGSFDVITSVHTMEHIADDRGFLERLARWTRAGGHLVLEVPLLARYPFRDVDQPLSPDHVREYASEGLVEIVSERFEVHDAFGINRGAYVDLDRARSAVLLSAVPRKGEG
jgi:SAM-dependent methyltransferase